MFEQFNPKPAKYQGINTLYEWFQEVCDSGRSGSILLNFQYILQGVAAQQLRVGTDVPQENSRRDAKEMPLWVVKHYGVEFSSEYESRYRYLYNGALKKAREIGLLTYHSESGKAIGLPAYRPGYIRVNPDAYLDMLKLFSQRAGGDSWDVTGSLTASATDPGWYCVPENVSDQYNGAALLHCHRYLLNKELELHVSQRSGTPRLLVRMAGEEINTDAAVMESFLARYVMINLQASRGDDRFMHIKKLFPSVNPQVFENELYSLTAGTRLDDEEEKSLRKLHEAITEIRVARAKKNILKGYGGREGLLATMGKDISQTIPSNCTMWLTLDRYEHGYACGLLHEIADDFIAGRLILNLPGTDPVK